MNLLCLKRDFYKKIIKNYLKIGEAILVKISYVWIFICYPLVYLDTQIWSRLGRYRFVCVTLILLTALFIKKWRNIGAECYFPIIYVFYEFWYNYHILDYRHWGDLKIMYILSPLFLYLAFLSFELTEKNLKLLNFFTTLLLLFILKNSTEGFVLVGLNRTQEYENFNYLIPAYGLVSAYILGLIIIFKYKKFINFLYLSIIIMISIFLSGSRGAIIIFFGLFIYSSIILFNFNKIVMTFLIAFLVLMVLFNNSSETMKGRYNAIEIFSDQSYLLRLKYIKDSLNIQENKMTSTVQENKMTSTVQENKIITTLLGQKLIEPNKVKMVNYNHNILELISNNGIIFIISLISFFISIFLYYRNFKLLFLIIIPTILSFVFLSDLIVFLWALIGIMQFSENRKQTNF